MENDKLDIQKLNNLPHPLVAELLYGGVHEIESICVESTVVRINACGKMSVTDFVMIRNLIDCDGNTHNADDFWLK